ncbi:MAG: GDP-mannose 4,6-dehydratase [Candidatus Sungbacteria bacterium]|nr:GDP-mannose 4,6-dehydratase [Candidatus Sungbacteria bacterium]
MMPRKFKKILITGIGGSGGSYLAEYIVENYPEVEVHGIARWHSTARDNLSAVASRVKVHEADLTDFASTFAVLKEVNPDGIFHLASHANVRASFVTPGMVLANNIIGTSNLFEAVRILGIKPLIQQCSTGEVYGQVDQKDTPITEEAALRPASPYAVSKVTQDLLARVYYVAYQLPIIRTRMFTYINPKRADLFATAFARQVARVEAGLQSEVAHGNLDSIRAILDVRDGMRAYWEALLYCDPGDVYNIGGTAVMSVGEFLKRLTAIAKKPIPLRLEPSLLRPADISFQIPDTSKFFEKTGWKPKYSVEESIAYLLDYWRNKIKNEES